MIELRTPGELDAMRAAGAVVADMLAAVRAAAAPGVRLSQLDAVARLAAEERPRISTKTADGKIHVGIAIKGRTGDIIREVNGPCPAGSTPR